MLRILFWGQLVLAGLFLYTMVGRISQKLYRKHFPDASYFSESRLSNSFSYDLMPWFWPVMLPITMAVLTANKIVGD